MYRKDLFDEGRPQDAGAADLARRSRNSPRSSPTASKQQYGICLRGKPGWGENHGLSSTTLVNTFGRSLVRREMAAAARARSPGIDAVTFYVHMLKDYGPPGASSNGFNENLALFSTGHCAHVDRRDRRRPASITDKKPTARSPTRSPSRQAPIDDRAERKRTGSGPGRSRHAEASSKKAGRWRNPSSPGQPRQGLRRKLVGEHAMAGPPWPLRAPAQIDLRQPAEYTGAAPFANAAWCSRRSETADLAHPSVLPVPYSGIQYVAIPEFSGDRHHRSGRSSARRWPASLPRPTR